jgi:serine protease Do
MEHFLRDNHDFTYNTATTPPSGHPSTEGNVPDTPKPVLKPASKTKKQRFRVAVTACILAVVLGLGTGVGGTLLAAVIIDANFMQSEPGIRPQIPSGTGANVGNASDKPAENLFLTTHDTLVVNNNNTKFTPEELFEVVKDGVVGIEIAITTGGRFFSPTTEMQLVGSGFIFTTDGYVLTNHHVIEKTESVVVLVDDYDDPSVVHRFEAEIIGSDQSTDLAVLKISRDEGFRALPIGDSSSLKVGTFVSPIGFPLGLEKSMTHGIVSGLNREFASGGYELSSIQFDAAVNSGNSGGPLFDMYGSVVGIVNKKLVFENLVDNIGLAITIDEAKPIINDLLLHGAVMQRPKLGIIPLELNEYTAALYNLDVSEGILVRVILKGAPALYSELTVGDVIIEVEGVTVRTVADVQSVIRNNRPGDTVELTVIRINETGGQNRVSIEIQLANDADLE